MRFSSTPGSAAGPRGASIRQIATVLGVPDDQVRRQISGVDPAPLIEGTWVPDEIVRVLLKDHEPAQAVSSAEPLVIRAFEAARDKGKANWEKMALPVLKNRLLSLTSQSFRESTYGCPNLHYFVGELQDLVEVINTDPHSSVQIIRDLPPSTEQHSPVPEAAIATMQPVKSRVRPDIWRATLDYRDSTVYVWDIEKNIAREGDPSPVTPLFPTAQATDLAEWREGFVHKLGATHPKAPQSLAFWAQNGGSTMLLPPEYRGLWNGFLRDQVVERASAFFVARTLAVPGDIIVAVSQATATSSSKRKPDIRDYLTEILENLTDDELAAVTIPVGALLRMSLK